MASIPCAAYQVTYIHDNLRRKNASNPQQTSCHSQMRAIEQFAANSAVAENGNLHNFFDHNSPITKLYFIYVMVNVSTVNQIFACDLIFLRTQLHMQLTPV